MNPIVFHGGCAFSDFRISALLERFAGLDLPRQPADIEADFVYFLDVAEALSGGVRDRAYALLGADREHDAGHGFYVTPRKGTISPWSSKATDIFHNCGLASVRRVERGVFYRLRDSQGEWLDWDAARPLFPLPPA